MRIYTYIQAYIHVVMNVVNVQAHSTWRITHLLVPHQHGQADSCDITHEEDVAEYQDDNELITLGWIHVISFNWN